MTHLAPLRLDALPARRFLPPDPGTAAGEASLRERWGLALGVAPEAVVLAESPGAAFALAVAAVTAPGDRVAVAEPCPEDHYRVPLACGARVVDVGRDARLRLRADALALVLRDGARVVLVADPGDPVPHAGEAAGAREAAGSGGVLIVEDRRAGAYDPSSAALQVLSGPGSDPVGVVVAPPADAAALRRLRGPLAPPVLHRARDAAVRDDGPGVDSGRAALVAALGHLPAARLITGPAPHALLRLDGVDGASLVDALTARGVVAVARPHHTWRGGARLPLPVDAAAVVAAVTALLGAEQALPPAGPAPAEEECS